MYKSPAGRRPFVTLLLDGYKLSASTQQHGSLVVGVLNAQGAHLSTDELLSFNGMSVEERDEYWGTLTLVKEVEEYHVQTLSARPYRAASFYIKGAGAGGDVRCRAEEAAQTASCCSRCAAAARAEADLVLRKGVGCEATAPRLVVEAEAHRVQKAAAAGCIITSCSACYSARALCDGCAALGEDEWHPLRRRCGPCRVAGASCDRAHILFITSDQYAANMTALKTMQASTVGLFVHIAIRHAMKKLRSYFLHHWLWDEQARSFVSTRLLMAIRSASGSDAADGPAKALAKVLPILALTCRRRLSDGDVSRLFSPLVAAIAADVGAVAVRIVPDNTAGFTLADHALLQRPVGVVWGEAGAHFMWADAAAHAVFWGGNEGLTRVALYMGGKGEPGRCAFEGRLPACQVRLAVPRALAKAGTSLLVLDAHGAAKGNSVLLFARGALNWAPQAGDGLVSSFTLGLALRAA